MTLWRPVPVLDTAPLPGALPLAGGPLRFDRVEVLERGRAPQVVPPSEVPGTVLDRLTAPRPPFAALSLDRPRIMGIVNVTPDSFSDGGRFLDPAAAAAQGRRLAAAGAELLDIGGESTRPGAAEVPEAEETARILPVIAALRDGPPISVDTRKAGVARAALASGAAAVNDVTALTHDAAMASVVAQAGVPVVLMHMRGTPETMQDDPRYDDVVQDVYAWLADRIVAAEAAGIPRSAIAVDPGIGFGKTGDHNLALIRRLSVFHGLGCAVMLGASRKRFVGTIGGADRPEDRMPGSVAVALAGAAQGAQILRVHDVAETRQALALWRAIWTGGTA
ncbi:MAG: dihydropteroate synthase [Gemmobacter sp.]